MTVVMSRAAARVRLLFSLLMVLALATPVLAGRRSSGGGGVYVRGYTRRDGTYVAPHYRSAPDGDFYNNWSTKGNVNPYTGQPGTKVTPPPSYGYGYRYTGSGYTGSDDYWSADAVRRRAEIEEFRRRWEATQAELDEQVRRWKAERERQPQAAATSTAASTAPPAAATATPVWKSALASQLDTIGTWRWILPDPQARFPLEVWVLNSSTIPVNAVRFRVVFFSNGNKLEERLVEGVSAKADGTPGLRCEPLPAGRSAMYFVPTPSLITATSVAVYVDAWQ
jgi:hypothetical protein